MSSSKPQRPRPAPAPASKTRAAPSYTRFIPREELRGFSSWQPDNFGADAAGPGPAAEPEIDAATREAQREAAWRAQVQAARQSGYEDGYRDGLVALENFKQSFARQAAAQVGAVIASFDREFEALEQQIAATVARVAVQLARQVVRGETSANPALVVRVAEEALAAVLTSARHITINVHPDDLPLVAEGAGEALAARGARLVAQPAIERGGCRVDSDVGSVDARVEVRWQQAASVIDAETPWTPA